MERDGGSEEQPAAVSVKRTSPMEILKLLERSNCGECGLPTCLAFASQVSQGLRPLGDCPRLSADVVAEQGPRLTPAPAADRDEPDPASIIPRLCERIEQVDFAEAAQRLGVQLGGDRLQIHVLGRLFEVDARGGLHTMCHVNSWVQLPLLFFILDGAGRQPTGDWQTFGDLPRSQDWTRFFDYKCAQVFARMASEQPDLFEDILDLFASREPADDTDADWVKTLWPLPRVPIRFCYWAAEDDIPAQLTVLFDATASDNLGPEGIFQLCRGLAEMFQKIIIHHGG